jgi:hypothetical protein
MITFDDVVEWHQYDLKAHSLLTRDREMINWLVFEHRKLKELNDNLLEKQAEVQS